MISKFFSNSCVYLSLRPESTVSIIPQVDQISTNFFAKFIKAQVDKKRTLEELKELVDASIDMDKDGFIGLSDLEAFVGRASYH